MATSEASLQICPTRIDGSPVLFAHKVDRARCQDRQRKRYHKCFTCAWNNNYVALHGEPVITPEPAVKQAEAVEEVEQLAAAVQVG